MKDAGIYAVHTPDSTTGAASSEMVDHGGVTLDHAVDVQVASETSIRDLFILKAPDGSFDGLGSSGASLEETHGDASSTGCRR